MRAGLSDFTRPATCSHGHTQSNRNAAQTLDAEAVACRKELRTSELRLTPHRGMSRALSQLPGDDLEVIKCAPWPLPHTSGMAAACTRTCTLSPVREAHLFSSPRLQRGRCGTGQTLRLLLQVPTAAAADAAC